MQACLLGDKLQKAKNLVKSILSKTSIFKEELDFLIRFLCFAAKFVVPGCAFLQCLSPSQSYWSLYLSQLRNLGRPFIVALFPS